MNKLNALVKTYNYGIIHSQVGFSDGVSIVIDQVERIMLEKLEIPRSNIYYLVGKSKKKSPYIRQSNQFWHKSKVNKLVNRHFSKGFGGALNEKIELAIKEAKDDFGRFIEDKKIDVIIVHNSSHPVNFIYSVAISRYYRDMINQGKNPSKYILWWHDSHLERERYLNPPRDVKNYLLEGVPGRYVDYTIFINSLQFEIANEYYHLLNRRCKGFYEKALQSQTIIYNTASTPIMSVKDLDSYENETRTKQFLDELKINKLLEDNGLGFSDVLFCLQHTRIVPRKRIDFALEYSYELFSKLKTQKLKKAMIFIVSGSSGDERGNYKRSLIKLNKELSKKYETDKFFLIFSEDYKTKVSFEEMPLIVSRLGGISTYFSEIEGFGNNLLEVLAAGLIPIVYTYPVFVKDIAKYNFKTIALKRFEISSDSIDKAVKVIKDHDIREKWANKNISILRKKLSHETIAPKLRRAIKKKRKILGCA